MESTEQNKFSGWAKVEVMGHRTHVGYVETVYFGPAGFFRITQPALPEEETVLESARYDENSNYVPRGSKVRFPAVPSVLLAGQRFPAVQTKNIRQAPIVSNSDFSVLGRSAA